MFKYLSFSRIVLKWEYSNFMFLSLAINHTVFHIFEFFAFNTKLPEKEMLASNDFTTTKEVEVQWGSS